MNFWFLFLGYSVFQGLFLALGLLVSQKIEKHKRYLLSSLLLSLSLLSADFVFSNFYYVFAEKTFWGFGLATPFWVLISPLFYLVFKEYISEGIQFNKMDWLHFLPFIFSFCINFQFLILAPETRASYLMAYSAGEEMSWLHVISKALYHGQLIIYPLVIFRMISKKQLSFQSFIALINWGLLFIGLTSFLHLASFNLFHLSISWFTTTLVFISLTIFVHGTAFFLIFYPEEVSKPIKAVILKRYASSNLTTVDTAKLKKDLLVLMNDEKVFMRQKLSQPELAKLLSISTHQLSEFLNRENNDTFNNYINTYRIKEAQRLLQSSENNIFTIEAIASEVGFRSSATFYRSFKKHTGSSPTKWLESLQNKA